jgi:hypothetical protein
MARSTLKAAALLPILFLAACGLGMDESDPRYAEVKQANLWLKQLKLEDPDTAVLLAQECSDEVGWWLSKDGVIAMGRCMRGKYDEGVRAEPPVESEPA